jgi:RHS repeat-associated protein
LPVILCEYTCDQYDKLDTLDKRYVHDPSGTLVSEERSNDWYFYLQDRLGSVRQVVKQDATIMRNYTYSPYGTCLETADSLPNPFKFTGQFYDSEISQYHLRARMYDPYLSRFTARDPVWGKFQQLMTLYAYLRRLNNPIGDKIRKLDIS